MMTEHFECVYVWNERHEDVRETSASLHSGEEGGDEDSVEGVVSQAT